ncbi:MAG: hypothetical protein QOK16_2950 [Solirubrobacteraceae bacterium]|nr:hypothetical protein [Solirubrobacteraceae bacterium]MEA2187939.1 hypothetical protein [Solirubrobacteraceae bacterium]
MEALCAWEPTDGPKYGVMLYTFSYDIEQRTGGVTGLANGTFTTMIAQRLGLASAPT